MPESASGMRQRSDTQVSPSSASSAVASVAIMATPKDELTISLEVKRVPNIVRSQTCDRMCGERP